MLRKGLFGTTLACGVCSTLLMPMSGYASSGPQDRVSGTEKGSVLIISKVELRWTNAGAVVQDTFVDLTNDFPQDVLVKMYFINGDPPLAAVANPPERAHPGWNYLDNVITLTHDEPTYWSARTGLPKGVSPFTALDPGFPPGRPDPENAAERILRGYIVAFAVNSSGQEIRWNHLKGDATIVNYALGTAWEYNAWAFQAVAAVANGVQTGTPGIINLDGTEFAPGFGQVLMDFYAVGSSALSGPGVLVSVNTDLTLHPVDADLRQETEGPITTKADIEVWSMNEFKFTGLHRCITCWDQRLLSNYGIPNHFLLQNLQTDKGKARIDGVASQLCDVDFDPNNNADFPFPPGPNDPTDPRDIISVDASLLGVVAKFLTFGANVDFAAAGTNLIGLGDESATIEFDEQPPPPEATNPNDDPSTGSDWFKAIDKALKSASPTDSRR